MSDFNQTPTQKPRRQFIKRGIAAMSTLALGEAILLSPSEAYAQFWRKKPELVGLRKTVRRPSGKGRLKNNYAVAKKIKGVCLNCSTVCGIEGHVIGGRLVKVSGNPLDPNNGKSLCAKGQSGPTINDYPERLLYPLKRIGKRGEGKWQRITWDEAYDEIAKRIKKVMDEGVPEEVAIQIGRSRIGEEMTRFLNAIGSPSLFNHRALCSSNKRAANYVALGETDWETVDAANSKYILNFGSNVYEAHQGAIHVAKRVIQGRFNDDGPKAKFVTFDVRLSNTAGRSDEWHAPNPGSDGAVALGMCHAIMEAGHFDREFLDNWCNIKADALKAWLARYTPAWAAKESGLAEADIRRLALEFAAARPACVAYTNRGSGAHYNGFNADRAVVLLNAIVGSIGKPGGYCYGEEPTRVPPRVFPQPMPRPPAATRKSVIENPPEWPLANKWQRMKVGPIVYDYIKKGKGKLQVFFSYCVASPQTWPEGRSLTVEVLTSEKLIPFHICSDVVYSEQAHYADLILPDASYTERWGFDTRNNMELRDYVTLRQPMVPPPGECVSFVDSMIEIGKRIPACAQYFQFKNHEDWLTQRCGSFSQRVGAVPAGAPPNPQAGFAWMKEKGVWQDMTKKKYYERYRWELTEAQLKDTRVDEKTQIIYRKAADGRESKVGLMVGGKAYHGFPTPTRRFAIHHEDVENAAKELKFDDNGMPNYFKVPAFDLMGPDHLHLITFKWNVHTQGRTASQKYLSEIVHHNPLWMHTSAAAKRGLKTGDLVEITTYRGACHAYEAVNNGKTGDVVGRQKVPVFVTEGIHPKVIAISNSLGNFVHGRAATARAGKPLNIPAFDAKVLPEDQDLLEDVWWDPRKGGTGEGYNLNAILPIYPAPLVGMQGWYDTVCTVKKA